jgi:hypothetical protein
VAKKKTLPPIQYSPDAKMALVPGWSQFGNDEVWWTLQVVSPKTGDWVALQGGTNAQWMRDLGFNPYQKA